MVHWDVHTSSHVGQYLGVFVHEFCWNWVSMVHAWMVSMNFIKFTTILGPNVQGWHGILPSKGPRNRNKYDINKKRYMAFLTFLSNISWGVTRWTWLCIPVFILVYFFLLWWSLLKEIFYCGLFLRRSSFFGFYSSLFLGRFIIFILSNIYPMEISEQTSWTWDKTNLINGVHLHHHCTITFVKNYASTVKCMAQIVNDLHDLHSLCFISFSTH